MALPNDLSTVTVVAQYPDILGRAASGSVFFTPSHKLFSDDDPVMIIDAPVQVNLVNGAISFPLPVVNDSDYGPNIVYLVEERIGPNGNYGREPFYIDPMTADGPTFDLIHATPVGPVDDTYSRYALVAGSTFTGNVTVDADLDVTGDTTVDNLTVTGTLTTGAGSGNFSAADLAATGNLTVTGTSTLTGAVSAQNNLNVSGTTTANAFNSATVTTTGNVSVGSALSVTGATTLGDNLSVAGTVIGGLKSSGAYIVKGAAGTNRDVEFQSGSTVRWRMRTASTAEGGSNAGSPFQILAYDDAGTLLSTPVIITRSTGDVTLSGNLTVAGSIKSANLFSYAYIFTTTGTEIVAIADGPCTVVSVAAIATGGTGATVNATNAGADVLAANLALPTAGVVTSTSTVQNASVSANAPLGLRVTTMGTAAKVLVRLQLRPA